MAAKETGFVTGVLCGAISSSFLGMKYVVIASCLGFLLGLVIHKKFLS